MKQRRQFVIAVLVMSLSLLLLPVVLVLTGRLESGLDAPLDWLPLPFVRALQPLFDPLATLWYVGLSVLVLASLAELAIDRWGVAKQGTDDST